MNKMKEVMDVLGIKEGIHYNVIDTKDGDTVVSSPYKYDGETFVDCDGDSSGNDGILWSLIIGEFTIKPVIKHIIPKNTPNDTKVYVRDLEDEGWEPAYFAGFSDDLRYPYSVYSYGHSSFTSPDGDTTCYKYCKLA